MARTAEQAAAESFFAQKANAGAASDAAFSSLAVEIDLRKIRDLQKAMLYVGLNFEQRQVPLMRGINEGVDRLQTILKRELQRWTGADTQTQIKAGAGLRKRYASTSKLEGAVEVKSPWMRINAQDFGASWQGKGSPVMHNAWGRGQAARGAFLINGVAYKRQGAGRWNIKPLWGPNLARELERHAPIVRAHQTLVVNRFVIPEAYRQIDLLLAEAKARFGL